MVTTQNGECKEQDRVTCCHFSVSLSVTWGNNTQLCQVCFEAADLRTGFF